MDREEEGPAEEMLRVWNEGAEAQAAAGAAGGEPPAAAAAGDNPADVWLEALQWPVTDDEGDDVTDEGSQPLIIDDFSDDEDDLLDTTVAQAAAGKDPQGIPWETTPWSRAAYRAKRDADYTSYFNREPEVRAAEAGVAAAAVRPRERPPATARFEFHRNWRRVRPTVVHFQLRNLVWPVTASTLFYVSANRVMRWCNARRKETEVVVDVSRPGAAPGLDAVNVCTLCARHGLVAAGGFGGELVVAAAGAERDPLGGGGGAAPPPVGVRVTHSENGITNAIDIYMPPGSAGPRLACANNDQAVRLFDPGAGLAPVGEFRLPWAVNCAVAAPDGRLLCAVGDDPEGLLLDPRAGGGAAGAAGAAAGVVARLRGHADFSFAAAWHPDGHVVATGNQDLTTRVFDLRAPAAPLAVLRARIGAVRSLRFSPDGRTLAVVEPADYVTLYDVAASPSYSSCQTIDLFGELAGVGFSPDSERFFVAVADVHYASLLQFNARPGGRMEAWEREGRGPPWPLVPEPPERR